MVGTDSRRLHVATNFLMDGLISRRVDRTVFDYTVAWFFCVFNRPGSLFP